jgi:hypothetical protein
LYAAIFLQTLPDHRLAGKGTAPRQGEALKYRVVRLAETLDLRTRTEVKAARRLWGAKRRIDVVVTHKATRKVLGIECKYQGTSGSAEEKIPATIKDIGYWPIPGIVVIDGPGFSENMKGFLMATGKAVWFEDLEDWLRLFFVISK